MLARVGALLTVGIGGLLAAAPMPNASATESGAQRDVLKSYNGDSIRLLLSPEPMSGERFMAYYVLAYR